VGAAAPEEVRVLERQLAEVQAQLAAQDATTANRRRELAVQRATLLADTQGLNRLLREAKLVAPVQGVVSAIAVKAGETASGAITLVASGSLRVKAKFAEVEAGEIHPGQQARIEVDALPDTPLAATVADLGVQAEIQGQGGNALLPVTLRFVHAAAAAYARSGYTVTARITTQRLPDALHLPLEALMEEERKGRMTTSVWRVDPAQRTVAKVPVRVLVRSLTRAAIAGLPAGTRVVTLPPDDLKAGARVRWETRRRRR
jgi:multidrug resistance efflux pump